MACSAILNSKVQLESSMWMSIPLLAQACGCAEIALRQCLLAGSANYRFQWAGGFVRVLPHGTDDCVVTAKGAAQTQIVLKLCSELTTQEQPWLPVIVLEHVACCFATFSCAQLTATVNCLRRLDWVRLSSKAGTELTFIRAMTREADTAVAREIVTSFCQ